MRRMLTAALLIAISAVPLYAQRRAMAPSRGAVSVGVRPSGRVIIRGGVGFGHNPGFGVFFNSRPFHRRFFRPHFPYAYPYSIYPYYPYGLQSDFVYSNMYAQPSYASDQAAYMAQHDTGLQNDLYRLQAELDEIKQQQAAQRSYASAAPPEPPRPMASTRGQEGPATVLVYRDGRKAEVRNYAIVGQTLWIFSEERARKVPLAELDLDATRSTNEERGVEFSPHAPPPTSNR